MNSILSTCGTSLLTNEIEPSKRSLIYKYSNFSAEELKKTADWNELQTLLSNIKRKFLEAAPNEASNLSAEWSCLQGFMDKHHHQMADWKHYILPTDTYLGQQTASILAEKISSQGGEVIILNQRYLQTQNASLFKKGISELEVLLQNTFTAQENQQVIFNLTGGFKILNAYLQTLALKLATKSIYTFERTPDIIEIPS